MPEWDCKKCDCRDFDLKGRYAKLKEDYKHLQFMRSRIQRYALGMRNLANARSQEMQWVQDELGGNDPEIIAQHTQQARCRGRSVLQLVVERAKKAIAPTVEKAIDELCSILDEVGAKVTFDPKRDITRCYFCGAKAPIGQAWTVKARGRPFNSCSRLCPACVGL